MLAHGVMGTERKEPAPERGEGGHPDFTECVSAPSLSPRSGAGRYDDIFPALAHWASLCRPCRGSAGISEGLSRWYAQDLAHFLENERCSNSHVPHPSGAACGIVIFRT